MTDVKRALAQFIYDSLEERTRDSGDKFVTSKDSAPEWVQDVCREAHGNMMPDDWRYQHIALICGQLADAEEWDDCQHGICDDLVDVYNGELLRWVASNLTRAEYVNDALTELGLPEPFDLFTALQYGQYQELGEIYSSLVSSIEERAEDLELWCAGWNMAGFMPDMEPGTFADFDNARDFIVDELQERDATEYDSGNHRTSKLFGESAQYAESQKDEFSIVVEGAAYWVQKRDISDALKD